MVGLLILVFEKDIQEVYVVSLKWFHFPVQKLRH